MEHLTGFCITSIAHNFTKTPDVEIKENFDFGEALESVYPLLDIIFDLLPYKDLVNVGKVKKSWGEITDKILRKRDRVSWFSCYKKNKNNFLKHNNNLLYGNYNTGILLLDYRRLKPNKYICLHVLNPESGADYQERMTFTEYLKHEILNESVNYCILSCPKVVSLFSNEEYSNGSIFDGILIPQIPGIKTSMFHCNPLNINENYIDANEEIKCILIFALNDLNKSIENLFKSLLKDLKPEEVAVGGGIIRGSKILQNVVEHPTNSRGLGKTNTFCIAFTKEIGTNPNFSASSFVIKGNNYSSQEFHEMVMKYKERIVMRSNSFAFRICCVAKYEKDEESIIFNKHFPTTPLLGFEADGEIGWNSLNLSNDECNETQAKKSKKPFPTYEHEWSTVFVIISWGPVVLEK